MHDVFISYAHDDNGIPRGASLPLGWVTLLAENLNVGPGVRRKDIFIDHRLQPGDAFAGDLVAKVEGSAVLVVLLSQNYVDSVWCGKELEHFVRSHANDPQRPADVFVVELHPFEELERVPEIIQQLRGQLIHAKFWFQPTDSPSPFLAGYPSPLDGGEAGKDHYWRELNKLRVAVDSRLRSLRAQPPIAPASQPLPAEVRPEADKSAWSSVLLADVTDDLESQRNAMRAALEAEGIAVLPEGDYVGLSPEEFEQNFTADLAKSERFVQLLSPVAGRKPRDYQASLPQLQYQRALAAKSPIMQWCERLPAMGEIADPGHAALFATESLRVTHLAGFQAEVIGTLRAAREQREREEKLAKQAPALEPSRRRLVFMDDLASQPGLNDRLRAIIKGENCDIRSLPPNAPLGNNGIDVKEVLKPCRAGITVFADRAKFLTVYNRLTFLLNQVAEGSLPVARWGVYLEQGTVQSEFGIDSEDVVPLDEQGLADFLRGL
ncbi:TIR domain-containing protein [Methyloterricola oryzae]|uniref:TIR domain-containing protein n=1 Tax=Methyloterricola oryzae TaxID=1495050 RepID=UPI0005EB904D|nr:TIR domain-containing protein [Methyloterricola oryzae]